MFLAFPSLPTDLNWEHRGCKRSYVWAVLNFTPAVWFRAVATGDTVWHAYPCRGMRCLASFTVPQLHYIRLLRVFTGCRWLQRVPHMPCCVYCVRLGRNSVWVRFTWKETSRGSDSTALNGQDDYWTVNWTGCGSKWPWPDFVYCLWRKATETLAFQIC